MKKGKLTYTSKGLILTLIVALLAPVLANEKPLFVSMNNRWYFPALSSAAYYDLPGKKERELATNIDWKKLEAEFILFPPIPYSPLTLDKLNSYCSPFDRNKTDDLSTGSLSLRYRHWLGTDRLGHDTMAQLIFGLRTAIIAGIFSMLIAVVLGFIAGITAGYFSNDRLCISLSQLMIWLASIPLGLFYAMKIGTQFNVIPAIIFFLAALSWPLFIRKGNKYIPLPVDALISSLIEIFISLPRLLLILVLTIVTEPSLMSMVFIIGLTSWTEIARIVRVETLKLSRLPFSSAALICGLPMMRIWINHLAPNLFPSVKPLFIYGIFSAVLLEAGLSFIGAGTSPEVASWGKMMYEGKQNYEAWWLVIFPGITLFGLLFALRKLGAKKVRT